MKLEGRLTSFLKHSASCISAVMASTMPDKEEASRSSLEVKEEEQAVGARCEMQ